MTWRWDDLEAIAAGSDPPPPPSVKLPDEIQTMIDECADGSWQGVILVGSNHHDTLSGPNYLNVALLVDHEVYLLLERRKRAAASGSTDDPKPPQ